MSVLFNEAPPAPFDADVLASTSVVGTLPMQVDLILYRGDDFFLDIAVTDADGAPVDLTGYTATSQLRATADTVDPPMGSFTCTTSTNVVHLHLPAANAKGLAHTAVWDVQIADAGGVITTLAYGAATIQPDVTRP